MLPSSSERCCVCTWAEVIFVVVLQAGGYDVVFSKGKAFLIHVATGKVKEIGVKIIYKLEVESCTTLSRKVEKVQSRDAREL